MRYLTGLKLYIAVLLGGVCLGSPVLYGKGAAIAAENTDLQSEDGSVGDEISMLSMSPAADLSEEMTASDPDLLSDIEIDLSLNSAVLFALNNNPDIEIYWERYDQAQYFTREGEADFYPQVNLSLSGGRAYNDPSTGTDPIKGKTNFSGNANLSLEQLIFDGFGTLEEVRRREKLGDAAFWRAQNQIEQVLTNTVENYLDVVRYSKELATIEILIKDVEGTLEYVTQQYEEGASDKVILDYANSRLAFAVTEYNRAKSSLNDAISRLEFLTGKLPPKFKAYYPEELDPDKIDLEYYLKQANAYNSRLVASEYEIEAMQHQLEVQKAQDYPEVNFVLSADQSHNNGGEIGRERELSGTFQLSYNIFDGFQNKYAKRRIRSQVNELTVRKAQVYKELQRDIKLTYNQVEASTDSISTTNDEIRSSIALKKLNEENFRLGNINVIELIESAERLNSARLKKVDLTNNLYNSTYRLLLLSSLIDQNFFCETC